MGRRLPGLFLLGSLFIAACGSGRPPSSQPSGSTHSAEEGGSGGAPASTAEGASTATSGGGGEGGAAPEDILVALKAISGLTVDEQPSQFEGYRRFILAFDQPADHNDPGGQRFQQRMVLQHRSTDAPFILASTGYNISVQSQGLSEPAKLLAANEVRVEHRFFAVSRPEKADWADLTIEQAAADHHRIVAALKPVYTARWLSTGVSKGGMTSVYHRRFYPGDVDATVAYVAPESFGTADPRYLGFLEQVGDAACREALKNFQHEVLSRRQAMLAKMQEQAAGQGIAYDILGPDRALESATVELPFTFWQYNDASLCATIPKSASTDDEVWSFLDKIDGPSLWSDTLFLRYEPYFFQAGTQLGYPAYADAYLAPLLLYPGLDVPATYVAPGPGKTMAFQPTSMKDVASWVAAEGKALLFIYGENDPYSAAAFDLGAAKDSYRFFVPAGTHGSKIVDLPEPDRQKALDALFRWSDVKPSLKGAVGSKARTELLHWKRELSVE